MLPLNNLLTTGELPDKKARETALNPASSYIVQAPAGSGKTELLTQRFLTLLTCVEKPDSILALTFTKKAAAEMQHRILSALQNGESAITKKVLAQDKQLEWNLLQYPNQLRIQTIDAFCANIVASLGLQQSCSTSVTEDAAPLYREAAERCLFESLQDTHYTKAMQTLLQHCGHEYEKVLDLLADMLSWREQWLRELLQSPTTLQQHLYNLLKQLHTDLEHKLTHLFSEFLDDLKKLLNFAKSNGAQIQAFSFFQEISHLLFTKEREWRNRIDKNLGFPPTMKAEKKSLEEILEALKEPSAINLERKQALIHAQKIPSLDSLCAQEKILRSLSDILPLLVAHLQTLFNEKNTADFIEIAANAGHALGTADNPTDLSLYWDYRLQHILIDEFQDTSHRQFQLLEKLTLGWQAGDNRTLFAVGDPMQSIYRFREADVGWFLYVKKHGIGDVSLQPLQLVCNFRSQKTLVNWVNQAIGAVFPKNNDLALGMVQYHASQAIHDNASAFIAYTRADTPEEQSMAIIESIQKLTTENPTDTIAILVRSRSHLANLLPLLKKHKLSFEALDMDSLLTRTSIADLFALTTYLLQPANRLAFFSVLRAPWCGLSLQELLSIEENNSEINPRFECTKTILETALKQRNHQPFAHWIESTWRILKGHLCISSAEKEDIECFFELLESYTGFEFNLLDLLEARLNKLYSRQHITSNLKIMTIHKAKGLEFDHVLLPHLEKSKTQSDSPLLHHVQLSPYGALFSAKKAYDQTADSLYQYIEYLDKEKDKYESERLLYVALTRAKKTIHCFAVLDEDKKLPQGSFLCLLHSFLPKACEINLRHPSNLEDFNKPLRHKKRLVLDVLDSRLRGNDAEGRGNDAEGTKSDEENAKSDTECAKNDADNSISLCIIPALRGIQDRITGTFIHLQIQYYTEHCAAHKKIIDMAIWIAENQKTWNTALASLKIYDPNIQSDIKQKTQKALLNLYNDPTGQWIITPYIIAQTEWTLYQGLNTLIIDRSFVDNDIRWIIDYKTGETPAAIPEEYQQQLEQYAHVVNTLQNTQGKPYPIHLGLYYPLTNHFFSWAF